MNKRQKTRHRRDVRHRSQLFGGRATAEQLHRQSLRGPCGLCGGPPAIRLRSIATLVDLKSEAPQYLVAIKSSLPPGIFKIPTFPTKYGEAVIIGTQYACSMCSKHAQQLAAKGPSWVHVEIDMGPGPENAVVAVPS